MSNPNRVSGKLFFKIDGTQYKAKGNFTYNLGNPKRETVTGADAVHGYKEMPGVPFVAGEITDSADLDLEGFQTLDGVTLTLELANGKTIVLHEAWYAADGDVGTEEANVQVRFEGLDAEEVKA